VGDLAAILGLLGKRDIEIPKGVWGDLWSTVSSTVTSGATDIANQFTQRKSIN
jgi:hypothetical protein